jgi:hypothetical protein
VTDAQKNRPSEEKKISQNIPTLDATNLRAICSGKDFNPGQTRRKSGSAAKVHEVDRITVLDPDFFADGKSW